jgi:hypothetical protein
MGWVRDALKAEVKWWHYALAFATFAAGYWFGWWVG